MKMDAAEPFNVPVNPEALGIPVSTNMFKELFLFFFLLSLFFFLCFIFWKSGRYDTYFMFGSLKALDIFLPQLMALTLIFLPFAVLLSPFC